MNVYYQESSPFFWIYGDDMDMDMIYDVYTNLPKIIFIFYFMIT